jgi:hypothetical protein
MSTNAMRLYAAVTILFLAAVSNATYLNVLGPSSAVLQNGQSIYLGKVGPGESFYLEASASTTNATGFAINIGWDRLEAASLPTGWYSQPSLLYENPMKMKVTVPSTAQNGTYNLTIAAINVGNYSKLGNFTFSAYVNVTPNVFNLSVTPSSIQSGVDEPTNLYISINNTGISDDPFSISISGLPAWDVKEQVVALHETQSTYVYPVYVNESGSYRFNVTVVSTTSPVIARNAPVSLVAQPSLLNDYSAVGQGIILSPVIFYPSYDIMLFLSHVYSALFG